MRIGKSDLWLSRTGKDAEWQRLSSCLLLIVSYFRGIPLVKPCSCSYGIASLLIISDIQGLRLIFLPIA